MRRLILTMVLGGTFLLTDWSGSVLRGGPPSDKGKEADSVQARGATQDWPQWRGPNRNGISPCTGLMKKWPEAGPPVLATLPDVGAGLSSPAVVGDRLYILGKRGKDACVIAFDWKAQKELWATPFAEGFQEGERATPTVDNECIYALGGKGDIACVTTAGKLLWRKSLPRDFHSLLQMGQYGYSESPLVDGDKVICCPGVPENVMVALNKRTGAVIWKAEIPEVGKHGVSESGYSSCMVTDAGGVRQYVNSVGRGLIGVAAKDGKFLWSYNRIANGHTNIPSPIMHGDHVFLSNGYGTGTCYLKLSADGHGGVKCQEEWFLNRDVCENLCGQSVIIGDYAYVGHGQYAGVPMCVDLAKGKVAWKANKQTGSGVAGLISADGMLIFRNESKELLLVEATPKGYHLVSVFRPEGKQGTGWSHPVIAQGCLFVRYQSSLTVYDLKQH